MAGKDDASIRAIIDILVKINPQQKRLTSKTDVIALERSLRNT
jgi:hypothetical protein